MNKYPLRNETNKKRELKKINLFRNRIFSYSSQFYYDCEDFYKSKRLYVAPRYFITTVEVEIVRCLECLYIVVFWCVRYRPETVLTLYRTVGVYSKTLQSVTFPLLSFFLVYVHVEVETCGRQNSARWNHFL